MKPINRRKSNERIYLILKNYNSDLREEREQQEKNLRDFQEYLKNFHEKNTEFYESD